MARQQHLKWAQPSTAWDLESLKMLHHCNRLSQKLLFENEEKGPKPYLAIAEILSPSEQSEDVDPDA